MSQSPSSPALRLGPLGPIAEGVFHVDLDDLASLQGIRPGRWLVVVWSRGLPIGQGELYVSAGEFINAAAFVAQAIDPVAASSAALQARVAVTGTSSGVIVCTRDRPDKLALCLASLNEQTLKPSEIIVVDNASLDGRTRAVAEAARVRYVLEPRPGLDIARNTGVACATADVIAYTDDDVVVRRDWLERLTAAFSEPDIMAVTGLVLPAELATDSQWRFERYWGFGRGFKRVDFGPEFFAADKWYGCHAWEIGAGANMAFRRKCFEVVGAFDERLDVGAAGCSGDSEYWHRILSRGFVCRYEPSAVAFHIHRRDEDDLQRQIFSYMRGHVAALFVQFERTGHWGNLRRVCATLPAWYAKRVLAYAFDRGTERDATLRSEIAGYFSGIAYYMRTPRQRAQNALPSHEMERRCTSRHS